MPRALIGTLDRALHKLSQPHFGRDEAFRNRLTEAQRIQDSNEKLALLFFQQALASFPDPKRRQGARYPLRTIVVVALMAMIGHIKWWHSIRQKFLRRLGIFVQRLEKVYSRLKRSARRWTKFYNRLRTTIQECQGR